MQATPSFFATRYRTLVVVLLGAASCCSLACQQAVAEARSLYAEPWKWIDDSGEQVALSRWRGSEVLLTMAYSSCRATCALTLRTLESMQRDADARGRAVEIIVVSYDPHTDTPEVWSEYRRRRHLDRTNWHFLSGTPQFTAQLASTLGLGDFWSADRHIVHDFRIVQLDGDGRIRRDVRWGYGASEVAP
ncbi:MAG TPA: SCO family protein [Steroidobacteraceae bacterium]